MKHLLGLRELSKEDIIKILNLAKDMKTILKSETKKTPHLQGYSVVTLFYEIVPGHEHRLNLQQSL